MNKAGAPPQLHPLRETDTGSGQGQPEEALGRRSLPALLSKNVLNIGEQTQGENKILQDHEGVGL